MRGSCLRDSSWRHSCCSLSNCSRRRGIQQRWLSSWRRRHCSSRGRSSTRCLRCRSIRARRTRWWSPWHRGTCMFGMSNRWSSIHRQCYRNIHHRRRQSRWCQSRLRSTCWWWCRNMLTGIPCCQCRSSRWCRDRLSRWNSSLRHTWNQCICLIGIQYRQSRSNRQCMFLLSMRCSQSCKSCSGRILSRIQCY